MRYVCCAVLLLLTNFGWADPVTTADCEIPLQFRDGLLWVDVNGPHETSPPLHFLLDSGASASVLNLATARRLGLKLGPKARVTGVNATLTGYWPVTFPAKARAIELPREYLAVDLGKLSGACSRSVDGLIGADFFRGRAVEIDYAAPKLRVLEGVPAESAPNSVPLETRPCGFRVAVNVNGGKSQWVRVDTGCASAFQWVTSKEPPGRCTSNVAVGLAELSIPQTMTGLRIGNHIMDMVPTGLHRKAIFPGESGLLGNGLLAGFGVVTIDTKAGRLFLGRSSVK